MLLSCPLILCFQHYPSFQTKNVKYTYHGKYNTSNYFRRQVWGLYKTSKMGYVEILTSKVNGLNKKVRLMYCVLKSSTILKRCSFFFFDVKYSMLGLLRCTIHRIIRPNAFDVLYIEFSTYCIFRDRCMRPKLLLEKLWSLKV